MNIRFKSGSAMRPIQLTLLDIHGATVPIAGLIPGTPAYERELREVFDLVYSGSDFCWQLDGRELYVDGAFVCDIFSERVKNHIFRAMIELTGNYEFQNGEFCKVTEVDDE